MSATQPELFAPEGYAGHFARCGCGQCFTYADWQRLPLVGFIHSEDDDGHYLTEMRNCECGSTRAKEWVLP